MSETYTPPPVNGSAGETVTYVDFDGARMGHLVASAVAPAGALRTRRIAILGFGETVRDAPVSDPSWELWGMNGFWRAAKPDYDIDVPEERYSLWFDMHSVEFTRAYGKAAGFGDKQERWLEQQHPFPVLMLDTDPAFPSVQAFPIDQVVAALGRDYFTSTVAYALAWALVQPDVAEIGLWGIDLVHDTEYADQRPCAEYWVGRAESIGIKVTTHPGSALVRSRVRYGYEAEHPLIEQMRASLKTEAANLQKSVEKNQGEAERARSQELVDSGALQMVHAILGRLNIYARGGKV